MGVDKLSELIRSAVAIVNAPATLAMKAFTRIQHSRLAASEGHCSCNGDWIPGAIRALTNSSEDLNGFCADVLCALEFGTCRGTNMTVVGVPGSGKSMLFEPFGLIFQILQAHTYIHTCPHAYMQSYIVCQRHTPVYKRDDLSHGTVDGIKN